MFELVNRVLALYHSYDLAGRSRDVLSRPRDRGASAVEYVLILAAVAAAIAVMIGLIGSTVKSKMLFACQQITSTTCGG
jgi:Flp pilus assembly pilin Flp